MAKTPRILITGRTGQLASSLAERGLVTPGIELAFAARPELDLQNLETIPPLVARIPPDVIINTAAYTATSWMKSSHAVPRCRTALSCM